MVAVTLAERRIVPMFLFYGRKEMASWDKARDGCSCGKHGASVLEVVITTHGHADLHAHKRRIRHARAHTHLQTLIHMYMYTLTLALTTYICCHSSRQQYKGGRQECCSFSCKEKKKKVNLGRWQWGRLSDWFIAFSPCQTSSRACACVWCSPLLLLLPTPHTREDKKKLKVSCYWICFSERRWAEEDMKIVCANWLGC